MQYIDVNNNGLIDYNCIIIRILNGKYIKINATFLNEFKTSI